MSSCPTDYPSVLLGEMLGCPGTSKNVNGGHRLISNIIIIWDNNQGCCDCTFDH